MDTKTMSPTILVVFGATGDLMRRKIVPSLYHLFERDLLPERTCVVGFGRRGWDDARLREHVAGLLAEKRPNEPAEAVRRFLDLFRYFDGDFTQPDSYSRLSAFLNEIEGEWRVCTNKLFYLAVPPSGYLGILEGLAAAGLSEPCSDETGWTRDAHREATGRRRGIEQAPRHARAGSLPRGAGLLHRPLPRQGVASGHSDVPIRQQPVRDRVEPAGHRAHRDLSARAGGRRDQRAFVRPDRRASRRGPEPPARDARAR